MTKPRKPLTDTQREVIEYAQAHGPMKRYGDRWASEAGYEEGDVTFPSRVVNALVVRGYLRYSAYIKRPYMRLPVRVETRECSDDQER